MPVPPISPERRRLRARLAALERHHPDRPELAGAARAELHVADLEDHIRDVAGGLRPEQRSSLAALLLGAGGAA